MDSQAQKQGMAVMSMKGSLDLRDGSVGRALAARAQGREFRSPALI